MAMYQTQNMFNGGEISPLMWGRFDQGRYQAGCYLLRNMIPLPQGGITRRPGTLYCDKTKSQSPNVRLVPFKRSSSTLRMLEFGDKYMRVWAASGTHYLNDGEPYEIATPYALEDVPYLNFVQSADVVFVAHVSYPPAKISRLADNNWQYSILSFIPALAAPSKPVLTAGGSVAGSGSQNYSYVVTALDENGLMSDKSLAADINAASLSTTYYIDVSWEAVAHAVEYRIYRKKAGIYGFIGRTLEGTSFRDNNISPDIGDTAPNLKNPFAELGSYPRHVFFHQQRLGFASTTKRPLTVWLSQSANFESLSASIPPKDDDAIEATIAGNYTNSITFIGSDRDVLIIGTESGEYLMKPEGSSILTPNNVSFMQQSDKGSDYGLAALRTSSSLLFMQRGGDCVYSLNYNFQTDRYIPMDISMLASHLFKDYQVNSWAYQQKPYSVIWLARADGTMLGLTYLQEHDVIAWHRHDTCGKIIALACLPATDGSQDLLWLIVKRGDVYQVEIMDYIFDSADKELAYFVDNGASYYGKPVKGLSGLEWLEGQTVHLFTDGYVMPPRKIENGHIEFDDAVSVAHIGLAYISQARPARPEIMLQTGSTLMQKRRILKLKLRLYQTIALKIAIKDELPQNTATMELADDVNSFPSYLTTADLDINLAGAWDDSNILDFSIDDPCPATILALNMGIEI